MSTATPTNDYIAHVPGYVDNAGPKVVTSRFRYEDSNTLERSLATGGYDGLKKALTQTPAEVAAEVKDEGLRDLVGRIRNDEALLVAGGSREIAHSWIRRFCPIGEGLHRDHGRGPASFREAHLPRSGEGLVGRNLIHHDFAGPTAGGFQ